MAQFNFSKGLYFISMMYTAAHQRGGDMRGILCIRVPQSMMKRQKNAKEIYYIAVSCCCCFSFLYFGGGGHSSICATRVCDGIFIQARHTSPAKELVG